MPKKNHRTPQACLHLYNLPVPPAGYPSPPSLSRSTANNQKKQNEPNFRANGPGADQKMRNEPNSTPSFVPRTPNYAKRTQFATAADLRKTKKNETNPIYPSPSLAHDQIMQNEPNFHRSQISNRRFPPIRRGLLCKTNPIYCASHNPNAQIKVNSLCINDLSKIGAVVVYSIAFRRDWLCCFRVFLASLGVAFLKYITIAVFTSPLARVSRAIASLGPRPVSCVTIL